MQHKSHDVPRSFKLPVEKMTAALCADGKPYYTSTLAHMLAYAIYTGREKITLYGFEAESNTEYAEQRPCIEYWAGYGRGEGLCIEAPGSHLLKGEHYAYVDLMQGYRSRLELRRHALMGQLDKAETAATLSEGQLQALNDFKAIEAITPAFNAVFDEHFRRKNFVSFLRGTIKEINRAIEIYDAYRLDSDTGEPADVRRLIEIPYELG